MIQGPLCQAANYYVDSAVASDGIGTEAQPWKSLTKVNSMTFGPGDTIHFKRGGYWVGILDPKSCQGNSSARMVFRDYGDEEDPAPLLQGLNANEPVVRLDSPSYFTIQNFKITHPGATEAPRSGIYVHFWGDGNAAPGGSYLYRDVEIKNNEITDVTGLTSRTNGNNYSVGAIFVEFHDNNSSRVKVDGLLIDGNFIHDTRCLSIQFRPASNYSAPLADPVAAAAAMELWADNVVIRNNIMARTGGDHILVQGADAPLIENNAGYDAGINAVQDGNLWQAGMWVCFHTRNSLFQYNEVARTVNPLINNGDSQAFDVDYGTWGSHIFQYNYTHDNAGGVLIMMPRQIVNGQPDTRANLPKTVVFRYNVSANDGRNTLSQCQLGISPRVGVNSAHIHNNVFFTTRAEGLRFPEVEASFYTNNIFHAPSATYASKAVFSNNAYFGHTPVVEDPYKITADPLMAGPFPTGPAPDALINGLNIRDLNAPYKLQTSSPLINRGKPLTVPVALPAEDFWGYPLFQGNIDIGAHEAGGGSNPRPQAVYYTDNTDPSVLAVGAWTQLMDVDAYDGTRLSSSTPGDAVEFTFSGTTVALYGRTGPNMGQLAISHNGGPTVQTVNCYSSALKHRVKLYETNSVASGTTNTLRATVVARGASSSGDNVGIDYIVSTGGPGTVQLPDPVSVELDTESPGVTFLPNAAAWMSSRSVTGYYGTDYRHDGATAATVAKSVQFTPTLPFTATYKVYVRWPMANNYASNATFTVNHASGAVPFTINQRLNGGGWVLLGSYPFAAGTSGNVTVSNTGANGHVIADGVKFVTAAPQTEPVTVDNPPVANLPAFAVSYTPVASWNHSADPTFYNGTKSVANIAGQFVEFKFTGTKASLYVKKASSLGRLKIFVNGTLMTTVDCYSPTVVNQFKIYETPVLPNQLNTLKAVIEFKNPSSTGNYIGIDKFEFQP